MSSKQAIISLVITLAFVLVFFFIGKSYGKNLPPKPVELPVDQGGNGGQGAQLTDTQISAIVTEIKDDAYCFFCTRNSTPYVSLLALSNTDFVRAYNIWNTLYFNLKKETLREAIEAEWFSITSYTFKNIYDQLIDRFKSLGLK